MDQKIQLFDKFALIYMLVGFVLYEQSENIYLKQIYLYISIGSWLYIITHIAERISIILNSVKPEKKFWTVNQGLNSYNMVLDFFIEKTNIVDMCKVAIESGITVFMSFMSLEYKIQFVLQVLIILSQLILLLFIKNKASLVILALLIFFQFGYLIYLILVNNLYIAQFITILILCYGLVNRSKIKNYKK
ncbi:hypothetical protein [Streptococcus suis]|uniref:hypothetical protein n=1 Tax=Streptococcus suis TaxID=1307 RepID=UPI001C9794A8|nr:hypothetical protein [Streptococcus suis]MBY4955011.1 hypothetical protein [Streptococcus suis]MBY4969828.1 hypothetical protein [Streptococcus suis]MBY4982413.1 hypothetical protein [Streptococcus suis]MBY5016264.1 hypothetical protein [Streptococcus suis]MBY5035737.1 hypothetical protein [Streptococcus suis]